MLKRIHGIAIFFYQSRISKVLVPVIAVALILVLFFSGSIRAWADSNVPQSNSSATWTYPGNWTGSIIDFHFNGSYNYDFNESNNTVNDEYYLNSGYYDVEFRTFLNRSSASVNVFSYDFIYNLLLSGRLSLDTYFYNEQIDIYSYSYLGSEISSTNSNAYILDKSFTSFDTYYRSNDNLGVSGDFNYSFQILYNESSLDTSLPLEIKFRFRFYFITDLYGYENIKNSWLEYPYIYVNFVSNNITNNNSIRSYSNKYYLYNINEKLNGISSIQNIIENDSTGVSENLADINDSYNSAQTTVDAAVDDAIHDYDAELSAVEDMDFSSFFNTQRYALNFWRSVGEYILDSDNIGYIATGLIVVTVINLFVFLLRL